MGITRANDRTAAAEASRAGSAGPGKVETISELVHELRSPLSVITGYAALLREQPLAAPSTDFVEAIARGARELEDRLAALVDAHAGTPLPAAAVPPSADVRQQRRAEVLCIEDDRGTADLVTHVLSADDEISVVAVDDGAIGLELARERPPDLVLLDLYIGGMSGEDVLRQLRDDDRTSAVPVLVLSGAVTDASSARLAAAGADAVVSKPFLPDDLRQAARRLLDGAVPDHEDPLDPRYLDAFEELDDVVGLVSTMIGDADSNMRFIRAAVSAGDCEQVARRAHALRGAMANLGARLVARHSLDLESAARAGDDEALPVLLAALETAMDDAESALHRRLPALRDRR